MLRQETFLTNIESLMPGLQNLWSAVRRFLLSEETFPRLLISNAVTVVVMCVISVEKCAYLFDLSMFRWDIFTSRGTVSSKMWNLLLILSQMVMLGLRLVTVTSGGTVPPPGASCPSMSLNIVNFDVSNLYFSFFWLSSASVTCNQFVICVPAPNLVFLLVFVFVFVFAFVFVFVFAFCIFHFSFFWLLQLWRATNLRFASLLPILTPARPDSCRYCPKQNSALLVIPLLHSIICKKRANSGFVLNAQF